MIYYFDGNNVGSWKEDGKICQASILTLCLELKRRGLPFVCFFDANINYKIQRQKEKDFIEPLLKNKRYFRRVTGGVQADPFILICSNNDNAAVISNDSFTKPIDLTEKYRWLKPKAIPQRLFKGDVYQNINDDDYRLIIPNFPKPGSEINVVLGADLQKLLNELVGEDTKQKELPKKNESDVLSLNSIPKNIIRVENTIHSKLKSDILTVVSSEKANETNVPLDSLPKVKDDRIKEKESTIPQTQGKSQRPWAIFLLLCMAGYGIYKLSSGTNTVEDPPPPIHDTLVMRDTIRPPEGGSMKKELVTIHDTILVMPESLPHNSSALTENKAPELTYSHKTDAFQPKKLNYYDNDDPAPVNQDSVREKFAKIDEEQRARARNNPNSNSGQQSYDPVRDFIKDYNSMPKQQYEQQPAPVIYFDNKFNGSPQHGSYQGGAGTYGGGKPR